MKEAQRRFTRTRAAGIAANAAALRELVAFLVVHGFACAARARIAGAAAELLENVLRHAAPEGDASFTLGATLGGRGVTVDVSDDGIGFEPELTECEDPLTSGLARARALAESCTIVSRPGAGTRIVLEFAASSPLFADERGVDLSDLDFLEPALARRVLADARDGAHDTGFQLSPSLAVCVGRLLSAERGVRSPLAELWS